MFGIEVYHDPVRQCMLLLHRVNENCMSVIILLLIASISVAALFLAAFIWSVRAGQYDDEIAPAVRILFDDTPSGDSQTSAKAEE